MFSFWLASLLVGLVGWLKVLEFSARRRLFAHSHIAAAKNPRMSAGEAPSCLAGVSPIRYSNPRSGLTKRSRMVQSAMDGNILLIQTA